MRDDEEFEARLIECLEVPPAREIHTPTTPTPTRLITAMPASVRCAPSTWRQMTGAYSALALCAALRRTMG